MGIWSTTAATACLAIFASIWFVVDLQRGLPDTEAIQRIGEMRQSTAVFDADDQLAFTIFEEQRIPVALDHISPNLIHAVLAVEDQRFYDHHGFDLARIVKAALTNLRHGRVVQGGSTITQQLARQSFLTPDKTIRRKLQELILAARIEGEYSKDRILELYLNKVYFGDGLYGAEASARGYFGRHASEVSVSEAALLAGLVKSPSTYAPTVNPTRAKARRNVVLQAMLDTGAIDPATWTTARRSDVVLHDTLRAQEPHGQYFKEQVRRELVDRFGWQRVYQGGLRVFSTMALPMQIAAEEAIAASLKSVEERRRKFKKLNQDDVLQAALIALEPQTGHVWAMVGGRDFNESRFNRAVQARRQPGSAFKPFVYATALEAGYTPVTVIDHLNDPVSTVQGAWTPEDEHSSAGAMTMRTALRTSSNRAAVRMLQQVGIARTVQYAKQLGVGDVPSVPSLALGSGEVTLDSMTAAYAAFANHGLVPKPLLIRRVEDQDGRLLFENHETTTRAISDVTAFLMSTMMADVINAGTGARARRLGFTLPAAGKTGTTNDFNDAWFVGYTPHLAAGVWVGFDQPHTIVPNGFAADIAVPAWATFMKAATKNDKPEWLLPPPGITTATVCRISGKLATEGCQDVEVVTKDDRIEHRSMIYTEYFARGTEPTSYCDLHPTRGMLTKITAALGGETPSPSPARVDETGTPTPTATSGASAPTGAVVTEAPEMTPSAPVKKKRGFWSRVFGLGKDSEDGKPEAETKAPKKKPGG
ncbi:MAG: penicillin-binding protein [Acidobacteria bacterium]|nr:MAG: penicillin-binding protein [Acidobacteriota bacterium]